MIQPDLAAGFAVGKIDDCPGVGGRRRKGNFLLGKCIRSGRTRQCFRRFEYSGAVVGGLVAGDAGAVIGSRKKVNEIKSELITHDTRETFLNYFNNNERHSLFFDINAFQVFNDLIPEKEFTIVSAIKSSEIIKNQVSANNQKTITDQLRELAK